MQISLSLIETKLTKLLLAMRCWGEEFEKYLGDALVHRAFLEAIGVHLAGCARLKREALQQLWDTRRLAFIRQCRGTARCAAN